MRGSALSVRKGESATPHGTAIPHRDVIQGQQHAVGEIHDPAVSPLMDIPFGYFLHRPRPHLFSPIHRVR